MRNIHGGRGSRARVAGGIAVVAFAVSMLASRGAERMERAEEPEEVGLVTVSAGRLTVEGEAELWRPENHGFEDGRAANGRGWTLSGWRNARSDEAPEGKRYLGREPGKRVRLSLEGIPVTGAVPHLIVLWARTDGPGVEAGFSVRSDEVRFGHHTPLAVPDTGGKWRRVGFFVRPVPGATTAVFQMNANEDVGGDLAIDDVRVGPVTEAAFAKAWQGWRSGYPARDLSPRPEDGRHLGLFLRKALDPNAEEPLLIMGIGSSYTNMIGNGEAYIQKLRALGATRPIHYQKHVGSAVEFDYTKGWMEQHVLERQPDLVVLYSGGKAEDLDDLLTRFRARSTADVIVASLHLREQDREITAETVDTADWDAIRAVCGRHAVEFVENRREGAAYLREQGQPIAWLLKDAVHQNDHGALVIAENIARHFVVHPEPSSRPEERERWLAADAGEEAVRLEGEWTKEGDVLVNRGGDARISVSFTGNRLDVVGEAGYLAVEIDGIAADSYPAFHRTLIVPGAENHRPERGMTADRAPHAVILGPAEKIVPQEWSIVMRSDTGVYDLIGSVTGEDGIGHNGEDVWSLSGQIFVPSALWRRKTEPDGTYTNRAGDVFSFSVRRATTWLAVFHGERRTRVSVVQNAENAAHTVTLSRASPGEIRIVGFHVFQPGGAPPP